jgi:hypothetical protein
MCVVHGLCQLIGQGRLEGLHGGRHSAAEGIHSTTLLLANVVLHACE